MRLTCALFLCTSKLAQNFADFARQELNRLYERFDDILGEINVTVETFGDSTATIDQIFNDVLEFGSQIKKLCVQCFLANKTRITKEVQEKKKEEEVEQTQYWNPWVVEDFDDGGPKEEEVVEENPTGLMDKLIASVRDGDFRLE